MNFIVSGCAGTSLGKMAVALASAIFLFCDSPSRDPEIEQMLLYERLAAEQDWNALASIALKNLSSQNDPLDANWWHLAQAWRGRLLEDLFKVRQRGPDGLAFLPSPHFRKPHLAHISYAMGDLARARVIAFNALYSDKGLDYAMLGILARVESMQGNNNVAYKFLKAFRGQGKIPLTAERPVPEVPPGIGSFVADSPFSNLLQIASANPSDRLSVQYALAWLLLKGDAEGVYSFIEAHYDSMTLKPLPSSVQEALVLWCDYSNEVDGEQPVSPEWCLVHGVEEDTFRRFVEFHEAYLNDDRLALSAHRNTFWYYYAFSEK